MIKKDYKGRIIFHIDMNAFFCSVAEIINPSLRGKAFAIGREGTTKGVLSTASYEARKYGIHSAMPTIEALKKYPKLLVIHIDYKHYEEYHKKFVKLIKEYTDIIEVASIDEVYADMTELSFEKHPIIIAKEIQLRLIRELDLKASIGIGPTLFLAKMASDMQKPLGLVVLRKRDKVEKLYPLSVSEIYGIGKMTYPKLIDAGIKTIADFDNPNNKNIICNIISDSHYEYILDCINGKTTNIVDSNRYGDSQSISSMTTFDIHKTSAIELIYESRSIIRDVYKRLIDGEYLFKSIILTLRDSSFNTFSRRKTLDEYSSELYIINETIEDLIEEYFDETKSYRLLGVGLSNLIKQSDYKKEYNLFNIDNNLEKENEIDKLMSSINEKYGKDLINWYKDKK